MTPLVVSKIVLAYLTPFLVATYSALANNRLLKTTSARSSTRACLQ